MGNGFIEQMKVDFASLTVCPPQPGALAVLNRREAEGKETGQWHQRARWEVGRQGKLLFATVKCRAVCPLNQAPAELTRLPMPPPLVSMGERLNRDPTGLSV